MTILIASAIVWACWRRILGGWLSLPRSVVVTNGVIIAGLPYLLLLGNWQAACVAAGVAVLYWTPGHSWDDWVALWRRYGPFGLVYRLWLRAWRDGWTGVLEPVVMGPIEAAELTIGALFGFAWAAPLVWGVA